MLYLTHWSHKRVCVNEESEPKFRESRCTEKERHKHSKYIIYHICVFTCMSRNISPAALLIAENKVKELLVLGSSPWPPLQSTFITAWSSSHYVPVYMWNISPQNKEREGDVGADEGKKSLRLATTSVVHEIYIAQWTDYPHV